ncbi:MAG: hypothetical protein ACXVZM_01025 [Terriglobales bacterium]
MRSWLASILLFVVSAPLLAQTANPQTSTTTTTTTTTKSKSTAAKKSPSTAKKPAAGCCGDIKSLRDAVSAQQQQIQMLRDELQRRDAAVQQMQQQLNSLQSATQQAQSTAQTAESTSKANEDALAALKTNVASVQTTATATATSLQGAEKRVTALESPLAIKYKGITITPGGFISANINWRKNNQNLDNFAGFTALPFDGSSNAHLGELRFTGRYTRLSLLGQGKFGRSNVQAYYEMDFEGAAQTANETTTNSFQPRIRELWANVDAPGGVSFSGGQTWSLITANRTGVGPRGIMLPSHISASLVVGWHYTRQAGLRVYKTFDLANKKKFYFAFAAEEGQTTSSGSIPANLTIWGLQGRPVVSPGSSANCAVDTVTAGLAPCSTFAAPLSINAAPDLIGKVAFEPGWGHFEIGVMGRFFRDRVALTSSTNNSNAGTNHTTPAASVAFNAVLPVVAKKVDLVVTTLGGRGIGRYSPNGTDVTIRPNGTLQPLLGYSGAVGIETHPTPKLDFMIYAGDEYIQRSPYYTAFSPGTATIPVGFPTAGVGYGTVFSIQSGCQVEIPLAGQVCTVSNRNLMEFSPGFWYRFYRGPAGTIQYGMFYSYQRRAVWTGNQNTAAIPVPGAPLGQQHEILTAFRWYFP